MGMPVHVVPRCDLPENGVLLLEIEGVHCLVADVDGDVHAFALAGPAAAVADRTVVAEGFVRCPLHGWTIDPIDGRCGAASHCQYRPLPVRVRGGNVHVTLP
jgi:nitrite reductase/ring-hydroxylating ferredoxin subunit